MSARALPAPADERAWLKRAVLVLVRPQEVFTGLRDDTEAVARARGEVVLALILLAGIASVLWTPTYGRLMDDPVYDGLLVAVVAFIGGGVYGTAAYFVGGLILYAFTRVSGGVTYRQARHVLAFAVAPLALSLLVVWPLRLAVYGEAVFRSGGPDRGGGNTAFVLLELAFALWALALVALGLRSLMRR